MNISHRTVSIVMFVSGLIQLYAGFFLESTESMSMLVGGGINLLLGFFIFQKNKQIAPIAIGLMILGIVALLMQYGEMGYPNMLINAIIALDLMAILGLFFVFKP